MKARKFNVKVYYIVISNRQERRIVQQIDRAVSDWLSSQVDEEFASWFK